MTNILKFLAAQATSTLGVKTDGQTAPTSVMVTSVHEVSSLTTEGNNPTTKSPDIEMQHAPGNSPTKRSQENLEIQQEQAKKTRPDPNINTTHTISQPAGTPCIPPFKAGEETRGDVT